MSAPKRLPLPLLGLLVLLGAGAAAWFLFLQPKARRVEEIPLWTVQSGRLEVQVLEGGELEALDSHTVVSRVEGQAAIQFVVEEGTVLTEEDVKAERLLVQLDSAGIEEKLERQKIDLASARAAYENAVSSLEIQRQQNASDVRTAELDVRFALLDLARYVGSDLVEDLIRTHRERATAAPETRPDDESAPKSSLEATGLRRLILTLLQSERLEGEARQKIRQLDSDIQLAEEEYERAKVELNWSLKLEAKGYVSREEKEADRIALERRRIELERARIAREQYARYDFPKETESLLSGLVEAEDQLSRRVKRAKSAEAKSVAEVESRREQFSLQEARHRKLNEQLAACAIRADRPGLVVYATSGRRGRRDRGERIQQGTSVRERQAILTIPNLARLGVKADIHESVVERVKEGQIATVTVDAIPEQPLRGIVALVAPLPNPSESWFNPDRKVYATTISLDDIPSNVKPGMSTQVEILVADLPDVLQVPVQAVTGTAERPTVYLSVNGEIVEREVELGWSNDTFAEIRSGLAVGDRVLLAPPRIEQLPSAEKNGAKAGKRPSGAREKRPSGGRPRTRPAGKGKPDGATGGPGKRSGSGKGASHRKAP